MVVVPRSLLHSLVASSLEPATLHHFHLHCLLLEIQEPPGFVAVVAVPLPMLLLDLLHVLAKDLLHQVLIRFLCLVLQRLVGLLHLCP